jgi:hypothetical protein
MKNLSALLFVLGLLVPCACSNGDDPGGGAGGLGGTGDCPTENAGGCRSTTTGACAAQSCVDGAYVCPEGYETVGVCVTLEDGGPPEIGIDGGVACSSDIVIDCGDCGSTPIYQVCSPTGWVCPEVNCPGYVIDAGGDASTSDGGPADGGIHDGGPGDASTSDGGPDGGDVGDLCVEGASCNAGQSCSVEDDGETTACSCVDGEYACE